MELGQKLGVDAENNGTVVTSTCPRDARIYDYLNPVLTDMACGLAMDSSLVMATLWQAGGTFKNWGSGAT